VSIDKEMQHVQNGRILALNDNIMYPMLSKMTSDTVSKMIGSYKGGSTDFLGDVAYLSALNDIRQKLVRMQTEANKVYEKLNNQEKA